MKITAITTLLISLITFNSCKKDSPNDIGSSPGGDSGVYAVYSRGGQWRKREAFLWKDEIQTDLSNKLPIFSASGTNLYTTAVAVSSTGDVYIAGAECLKVRQDVSFSSDFIDSCYTVLWKNGVKKYLNAVPVERWFMKGQDVDMALNSNNDVFVLGRDGAADAGGYSIWKNETKIFDIEDLNADVYKIFAKGNDVYVCGKTILGSLPVAAVWKNGVLQTLNSNVESTAVSVSDNNDVYVGLRDGKLFKNNTAQTALLSTAGNTASYISDISCVGNDVYILGYTLGGETIIWKNGTQLYKLTSAIAEYNFVDMLSVFVSGSDVYTSGVLSNSNTSTGGPSAAVIYKNGSLYKTMFNGVGYLIHASSVFVK